MIIPENTKDEKIIKSIFVYYDKNIDNFLTFNEFKQLCNDLGFDLYDFQFKYIEENNLISYNEFKEWWLKEDKFKVLSDENFDKVYYAHDVYKKGIDEFGILTFDNFNKVINKYYGCSISEEEFNTYNKNHNNKMEFNEFLDWLRWI